MLVTRISAAVIFNWAGTRVGRGRQHCRAAGPRAPVPSRARGEQAPAASMRMRAEPGAGRHLGRAQARLAGCGARPPRLATVGRALAPGRSNTYPGRCSIFNYCRDFLPYLSCCGHLSHWFLPWPAAPHRPHCR